MVACDTFRLSPFTLPRKREVAETSPETPFSVMKERQESSGKVILMREAFRERPSIAIPETSTSPPHAADSSSCMRLENSTVLNEVSRYMYVPTNPPTTSRIRMQRPIRKRLFFKAAFLSFWCSSP